MTTLAPASQWILQKYITLEQELESNLEAYTLARSVDELYQFLWDSYADWYVEYLKVDSSQKEFAKELFTQFVITLHPYMPFETEVLWKEFAQKDTLLALEEKDSQWSKNFEMNQGEIHDFQNIISIINRLRSLRGLFAIDPGTVLQVNSLSNILHDNKEYLYLLGKVEVHKGSNLSYTIEQEKITLSLNILDYINDVEAETKRTYKQILSLKEQIARLTKKLENKRFIQNASQDIIEETKQNLAARQIEYEECQKKIALLTQE